MKLLLGSPRTNPFTSPSRGFEPGSSAFKSPTLTTEPRCLNSESATTDSCVVLTGTLHYGVEENIPRTWTRMSMIYLWSEAVTQCQFRNIITAQRQVNLKTTVGNCVGDLLFATSDGQVLIWTKQLSTVADTGFITTPNHIGSMTSFSHSTSTIHSLVLFIYFWLIDLKVLCITRHFVHGLSTVRSLTMC